MEVGAVKQAFNNELILLKKKLNQAKTQIIHKLTRKAKTFTERKAPEALKEKLKRKAESAVKEVLIIKKINPKDIVRFAVTHTGQLSDHLNKPNVDQEKACARLLLHKSLQDKYKLIKTRFSSIPIDDLLMSREERRKLKKEAREEQKKKRKDRENKAKNVVNAEGVWDVEDINMSDSLKEQTVSEKSGTFNDIEEEKNVTLNGDKESEGSDEEMSQNESDIKSVNGQDNEYVDNASKSDDESNNEDDDKSEEEIKMQTKLLESSKNKQEKISTKTVLNRTNIKKVTQKNPIPTLKEKTSNKNKKINEIHVDDPLKSDNESNNEENDISDEEMQSPTKIFKLSKSKDKQKKVNAKNVDNKIPKFPKVAQKYPINTPNEKKLNKNKNLNEKLLSRKFKKDSIEAPAHETKVVDPFFITSSGENYMTVVEPRPPDEVKEVHKEGNRKLRRAVMFGYVPKIKPRQKDFGGDDSRFNRNSGFNKNNNSKTFEDKKDFSDDKRNFINKRNRFDSNKEQESKPEKLHPSWEAKKRQSGIQPFQGKKIVFDES